MTTELEELKTENKLLGEIIAKLTADRKILLETMQYSLHTYENITSANFAIGLDKGTREEMRAAIAKVQE